MDANCRSAEQKKKVKRDSHRETGTEREERKKLIFLPEWCRNTMLCLMDTLTVKDTVKQGEGQLKFTFKFCYEKWLGPDVKLNSPIWKRFRVLLLQGNEMWLTVVYEPEPRCRRLLIGVEFKPQIVGSAGKGQTLHRCVCVGAKEWSCTVFSIIHLIRDRVMMDAWVLLLIEDVLPTIKFSNITN